MNAPSAKTFIIAAKVAKERAALADWMKKRLQPGEEPLALIVAHCRLVRSMEDGR